MRGKNFALTLLFINLSLIHFMLKYVLVYPGYQRSERGWGERERKKGGPLVTRAVNLTFMQNYANVRSQTGLTKGAFLWENPDQDF